MILSKENNCIGLKIVCKQIHFIFVSLLILFSSGLLAQTNCDPGDPTSPCPKQGCNTPDCNCPEPPGPKLPVIGGFDPNEITGPRGYDSLLRWVSSKASLPYKIQFENDPEFATAPAQKVIIYCPLHVNINPNTLRLGDFGFGSFNFTVPPNTTAYVQRLDVRDSLGVFVDITAGLDIINRRAFWILESIDPATGLASTLPANAGFLPVNDTSRGNGEGYVSLTLQAAATVQTRDTIAEQAFILFDTNDTIATNITKNTIDAAPPVSNINVLPGAVNSAFTISWTGTDDPNGSGVKSYDLYVSKNNGPFVLELADIDSTSHYFVGEPGATYNFYTRATDNTGNKEADKPNGEAIVTILVPSNTLCPGASTYFAMPRPGIGYTYQWQIDSTGTGFVNLNNNAVHSGAGTDTLIVSSPPTSYYGYTYRCIASNGGTTVYGTAYILKFQVSWQGTVSTAWENSANWTCGVVPDGFTDVLIPGALANNPVVNVSGACRSVKLSTGSTLNILSGVQLTLKGK
jgi:hypothetical protein